MRYSIVLKGDLLAGGGSGGGYDHGGLLGQLLRRPGRVDAAALPVLAAVGHQSAAQSGFWRRSAPTYTARTIERMAGRIGLAMTTTTTATTATTVGYTTTTTITTVELLGGRVADIVASVITTLSVVSCIIAPRRVAFRGVSLPFVCCQDINMNARITNMCFIPSIFQYIHTVNYNSKYILYIVIHKNNVKTNICKHSCTYTFIQLLPLFFSFLFFFASNFRCLSISFCFSFLSSSTLAPSSSESKNTAVVRSF